MNQNLFILASPKDGGSETRKVDIGIIPATIRDLNAEGQYPQPVFILTAPGVQRTVNNGYI